MEPVDSGQNRYYHNCQSSEMETDGRLGVQSQMHFSMNNFSNVQMIIRKRRRGDLRNENCHCHQQQKHQTNMSSSSSLYSSSSSSPLVFFTTFLLIFLCICPVMMHSLPYNSRRSSSASSYSSDLGLGGYNRDGRSQMDLLLDPIHQAEFGDDEPLESKRVVAKSVFDMVLRTTPSSNKCPPGTQSPFEGGPCIKKSTDSGPIIDQNFLLSHLIGLAKEGVILPTTPTKTRKRKPGRPGGGSGSRTTPYPATTTTLQPSTTTTTEEIGYNSTPTESTTLPTTNNNNLNNEADNTDDTATSVIANGQPVVFDEEPIKVMEETNNDDVPSTLPTTPAYFTSSNSAITLTENEEEAKKAPTSTSDNDEAPLGSDRKRTPSNNNEEQTTTTATQSSEKLFPTDLLDSLTSSASSSPLSVEEEEKSSSSEDQKDEIIATTTEIISSDSDLSNVDEEAESQINLEIAEDSQVPAQFPLLHENERKDTSDSGSTDFSTTIPSLSIGETFSDAYQDEDQTVQSTDEKDGRTEYENDKEVSTSQSPMTTFRQPIDEIISAPVDHQKDMTNVDVITSTSLQSTGTLDKEDQVKRGDISPILMTSDEASGNVYGQGEQVDDDADKIVTRMMKNDHENPKESMAKGTAMMISPSVTLSSSSEVEQETSSPSSVSVTADADNEKGALLDEVVQFSDEQSNPKEPIKNIEVESKRVVVEEVPVTTREPSARQEEDLPDAIKAMTMIVDESMTGTTTKQEEAVVVESEKKGVIGEEKKGDGHSHPSSDSPVVNQSDDREQVTTDFVDVTADATETVKDNDDDESGKGAVDVVIYDDVQTINNSSDSNHNLNDGEVEKDNKDDGEISRVTETILPKGLIIGDVEDQNGKSSSSRENNVKIEDVKSAELFEKSEDVKQQVLDPVTTLNPPSLSNPLFRNTFNPSIRDKDSTLLQFQLPIVSTRDRGNSNEQESGGFQRFPEFPQFTSPRIRFPSTSGNVDIPIEGGSTIRGTTRPVLVEDFQLDFPPQGETRHQEWQTPEPFNRFSSAPHPPQTEPSRSPTTQPEFYDTGSTEYLESELDRRHQISRSRNRLRVPQEPQFPSSSPASATNVPPVALDFYSPTGNFQPFSQHHYSNFRNSNFTVPPLHQQTPQHYQQQSLSSSPTSSSPAPLFFARRNNHNNPSDFSPFGYLNNFRSADRFLNNNRRIIW